jgi:hypothetical protein
VSSFIDEINGNASFLMYGFNQIIAKAAAAI